MHLKDRTEAGQLLARHLAESSWTEPIVLGLARGGVEVAVPVARALEATLDVAVARKIGAPSHPEVGVGAVTAHGPAVYDRTTLRRLGLTEADLEPAAERERAEARRRLGSYRSEPSGPDVAGRDVIVVDDGVATGVTARAAVRDLRWYQPARVVLAAPICAPGAKRFLASDADDMMCLHMPTELVAIGRWYGSFPQLDDDDVRAHLAQAARAANRR